MLPGRRSPVKTRGKKEKGLECAKTEKKASEDGVVKTLGHLFCGVTWVRGIEKEKGEGTSECRWILEGTRKRGGRSQGTCFRTLNRGSQEKEGFARDRKGSEYQPITERGERKERSS